MRPDAHRMRHHLAIFALLGVVGVVGCSGDDENPPDPPQQTGSTAETGANDTATTTTGDPFQVRDHEGSVVLYRDSLISEGDPAYIQMWANFGDDLRGVGTGQFCLDRGVCIHQLPENPGDFVELDRFFRSTEVDYDWVGERVAIGNSPRDWLEIPFQYVRGTSADEEVDGREYGFYSGSESRLDRDEVPPLGVRVEEGEWGDNVEIEAEDGIPFDFLPRLNSPSGTNVPPAAVVTFDWMWPPDPDPPEPPRDLGDTPLYLRVRSNELHRIYRLPHEGPFDLELGALGLNESSNVEFYFGRWSNTEARLNKNDLHVYGAIEKKLTSPGCNTATLPKVNLAGTPKPAEEPAINVAYLGVSFDGMVMDGGVYDYGWDVKGLGTATPTSSSLTFTAYGPDQQPLCSVQYDATRAEAVALNDVKPTNAARIFGAWEIDLANGVSDCNRLDSRVFEGYGTIPAAIESTPWVFALGELGRKSAAALEPVYGNDWATVDGQLYGLYVKRVVSSLDRCVDADEVFVDVEVGAVEAGAGFLYQQASCGVMDPALVKLPYRPGLPMKSGVYSTTPVVPFDAVLPACPEPAAP